MAGFIMYDEDENEVFTFGKYKGQKVISILNRDKGYFNWIQNADFPLYTKKVLKEIKERMSPKKQESSIDDLKLKFNQKL